MSSSYEVHSLLTPVRPAYSNLTLRRACVAAAHCGLQNQFATVCNYYHHLEKLEETYTAKNRAISRHCEIDLFVNRPPSSPFLLEYFPHLYPVVTNNDKFIKQMESMNNDRCVFALEGFKEIRNHKGVSFKQVLKTSDVIKSFCQSHMVTLRKFLEQFKSYVKKCQLEESIATLMFYVQMNLVKDELALMRNLKSVSFKDDFGTNIVAKKKENSKSTFTKPQDLSNLSFEENFKGRNSRFNASSPKTTFKKAFNVLGEIQIVKNKTRQAPNKKNKKIKTVGDDKIKNRRSALGEIANLSGDFEVFEVPDGYQNANDLNSSAELSLFNDSFKSCILDASFKNEFYSDESNGHYDVRHLSSDFNNLAC